ncbi:unnamed protein product [Soboliphyme baturini]|uniref:Fibronectin type-III domain-containing protein n=1 Tax=Soboliphyme baturini TaxID=241478 RepID=A0A3P8CXR0_9BILA|nr:unnamed protein product [Soboliphyme baturini]
MQIKLLSFYHCSAIQSDLLQASKGLDACKEQYGIYDFSNRCETYNKKCWKNLEICDSRRIVKKPPPVPSGFQVINEDDPYVVTFRWDPVPEAVFYFVQYKDDDDVFSSWNHYANSHETVESYYHFNKPNLCPSYSVRVAAVNTAGISPFTSEITIKKREISVLLPDSVLKCECEFLFSISSFVSKCGVPFDVSDLPVADSNLPGITFVTRCNNVVDSGCAERAPVIFPSCAVRSFNYTVTESSPDSQNETVNITWITQSSNSVTKHLPILYYLVKYDQIDADSQDQPVFIPKIIKQLGRLKSTTNAATLYDLAAGNRYAVQICAVYNGSSESDIQWNVVAWKEMDLTSTKTIEPAEETPYTILLGVLIPLSISLTVAGFVVWTVIRCKRERLKSLAELAAGQYRIVNDGRYVLMPTRTDQWETPRSKLLIYEDQKLGSGAFGAVYKGKIEGRLLTHKDVNSVLAEKWIKSENCDVAVKMLPGEPAVIQRYSVLFMTAHLSLSLRLS